MITSKHSGNENCKPLEYHKTQILYAVDGILKPMNKTH
jgi:hypothetical protein